ncbi:MAG TPA: TrkA family potassium uptake protein [Vicinamibacterales bacterium]|nr:TrkA family potassium uptake protein [Vicinamibacterales bacterium]
MARRSFAVIGLGRFGAAMATTLAGLGHDVTGIDGDEDKVRELADVISLAMQLDATDERALRGAGIKDVDVAVVSIGENIEASLLVVTLVKELGIKKIIAKAVTPLHGRILEKLGVTRVVFPERETAIRIAHSLVLPNVLDYIELSNEYSIVEVPAPSEFVGKTLREIGLRSRFGLTTIAIKHTGRTGDGNFTNIAPGPDDVVQSGDVLSLLGSNERLGQLDRMLKKASERGA